MFLKIERARGHDGFSLVEIMIVVLILGVLVAVALPTFLGTRQRAEDSAAQASVRTALTAGRMIFADDGDYASLTLSELGSTETSLDWVASSDASTEPSMVSAGAPAGILILAAFGRSGNCFFLRDDPPNSTTYGVLSGVSSSACYAGNSGAVTFTSSW